MMKNNSIKIEGACADQFFRGLGKKIGTEAAAQLKQTAIDVVQKCVNIYSEKFGEGDVGVQGSGRVDNPYQGEGDEAIPTGTTGLIYGRVQSGKTNATIATLAIAHANQFRCFIVLTSNNTWLGQQTSARFNNQLKRGLVVFDWEKWHKDPKSFAKKKLSPYLEDEDTGVVLVSTKQKGHLDRLLQVLKLAKAKYVPTLIFDDEADNASLNTNEAKQAKRGKDFVADSATFEKIGQIRKEVANHIYLQITATPQSLLLQNLDHRCKPIFCAALPQPGESYMGGNLFFAENSPYCQTVETQEIEELKKYEQTSHLENDWNIPKGLRLALCCFFLGAVYKMQSLDDDESIYSFLAHICRKKDTHTHLEQIISNFVVHIDLAIRKKSSNARYEQAYHWLESAHEELKKTIEDIPPLDELIEDLKYELRSAIPKVINADNPNKQPKYNPGMNILIGGNRLGRGVTIEGLMVTYYGRDAKQKVMDTVHQHARMYGYRQHLKDVTRLFLPKHILEDFRAIHESDEGMRQAIGDDPDNIALKPVWLGRELKPTRSNVLDPTVIGVFTPGAHIFPQSPAYKANEVKKSTEYLLDYLTSYKSNKYYEVNIDILIHLLSHFSSHYIDGEKWEDKRILQSLKVMKSDGIHQGRLYLRMGLDKNRSGLNLTRQEPYEWTYYGFASGVLLKEIKNTYPDVPTLIIVYEKGKKEKQWDDCPLFLPMLVLPQSQFVFMFNYSDNSETITENLEWQDIEEIDDREWLRAAAKNPAFDFLKDPQEDIYTLADGKPFHD